MTLPLGVLVTGSRDWPDRQFIFNKLDAIWAPSDGNVIVYFGDCLTGADAAAKAWCHARHVPFYEFRADWDTHGKAAGPLRNIEMVRHFAYAPMVGRRTMAFRKGGKASRGTTGCINRLRSAGCDPTIYEFEDIYS